MSPHDPVSSRWLPLYEEVFDGVWDDGPLAIWYEELGKFLTYSHYPYVGDSRDKDRFTGMRPMDTGGYLVHGHVHEKWRTNGRMFNVGVDAPR